MPRDPAGTLGRVEGGELRVGVLHAPPWARHGEGEPGGAEVDAARALGKELGARVRFVEGAETELLGKLHRFELDLVVGGLLDPSPYAEQVGWTRAYHVERRGGSEKKHVFAVPPGENAWLVRVERYLDVHGAAIADAAERAR